MVLIIILTFIAIRTLPELNKNLNEKKIGTAVFRNLYTKKSFIFYTRTSVIGLLLTALVTLHGGGTVLGQPQIGEGISIYNGLFQITQISIFIEIFILVIGALILVSWPALPILNITTRSAIGAATAAPASGISSRGFGAQADYALADKQGALGEASLQGYNSVQAKAEKSEGGHLINIFQNYFEKSKDYTMLIFFNLFGALLLISSFDLISLYLSIELQSFALYILATFYKESRIVTAAGLKYFLLGALSSCFILLGSALIYSFSGLTKFDSIYILISDLDSSVDHTQFTLGVLLIFIGFLFKIGAAPLHNWSPDVYADTPTIVTIWLTIMPKLSILILLLELYLQIDSFEGLIHTYSPYLTLLNSNLEYSLVVNGILNFLDTFGGVENYESYIASPNAEINIPVAFLAQEYVIYTLESVINNIIYPIYINKPQAEFWNIFFSTYELTGGGSVALYNLLFIGSLLSLVIGTVLGLAQSQIKRLLAYSTISHLGFILLSLSINTQESLDSFLFYILQYTITNLNVFLIIIAFNYLLTSFASGSSDQLRSYAAGEFSFGRNYNNKNLVIKDIKYISELTGQYSKNPILTVSFIICLLSMGGIPPFIGFYSKLFVLFSAITVYEYFIAIIAIIVSVISAYYYLRVIKVLFTVEGHDLQPSAVAECEPTKAGQPWFSSLGRGADMAEINTNSGTLLTNLHSLIISVLSLFLFLFFLNPDLILTSTRVLSLSLFNL